MSRQQATRCNRAQVDLHIQRQRTLGERMVGDQDKPRTIELIVTGIAIVALCIL